MSLVGPRPEDPEFVTLYSAEYERIVRVKPGLTGLCQLAFAKESELLDGEDTVGSYVEHLLPAKVSIDVLYAERRSLAVDCSILAWTAVAVVLRRDVAVNRTSGRISLRSPRVATDSTPVEQDELGTQGIVAAVSAAQATD
jgi:lipopolysaccharide/colanic/teichoic acid biosynthesis glycosyltransferase